MIGLDPICAVILCAGKGYRLLPRTSFSPKPLITIKEKPIIDHIIENFIWNDFEEIVIVLGFRGKMLKRHLIALQKRLGKKYPDRKITFHYTFNEAIERGNGYSGYLGLSKVSELGLGERVILSMGDHLYSYRLIEHLCKEKQCNFDILIATDPRFDQSYIDVEEATKVMGTMDGTVLQIGKDIEKYNRIDMGIFNVNSNILYSIEELSNDLETFGWTDVVKKAISTGLTVRYCDMPPLPWIDVDNHYDYFIATNLFHQIRMNE